MNPTKDTLALQDLLRLSPREATTLLQRLEAASDSAAYEDQRKDRRISFREVRRIAVLLESEPLGSRTFTVIPRNISRSGIALLHGKFVYNGTACVMGLEAGDGQIVPVRGQVAWCRLIEGRIHEMGIAFDEPIDLDDFMPQ